MEVKFVTEMRALEDLKEHPRNYRVHPQDQIDHIKASIQEHGVYRNVVVARDNTILAGHGVVKALRQLGVVAGPVAVMDLDPNDPRALKLLAGDNEVEHLAEQDDRVLTLPDQRMRSQPSMRRRIG
jgi:ParB family chromosome partitioning protein